MSSVERLDYGSPDGCTIGGSASDKVSVYGETPVVQASAITSVTTTGATSTTNAYGYTTAAQADAIVTAVNALIVAVQNFGITA